MAISFLRDSNAAALVDEAGLRPDFAHAAVATTGASIAEVDISSMNIAANQNEQGLILIRVVAITNACYFSLGPASTAPADTTTMIIVGTGSPSFFKAKSTDVSIYTKQITAAATVSVCALS